MADNQLLASFLSGKKIGASSYEDDKKAQAHEEALKLAALLKGQGEQQKADLSLANLGELRKQAPGSTVHFGEASVTPPPNMGLTPGQEAADKTFGKDYADYVAGGGKAGVEKSLEGLEAAKGDLKNATKFDRVAGVLPNWARSFLAPGDVAREDAVRNAVQMSLRQILGSQFTEKEADSFMSRHYNPRLAPEENMKRIDAATKELKKRAAQKDVSAKHFESTGSLRGLPKADPLQELIAPGKSGGSEKDERAEYEALKKKHGR